jgi:hypothetical protein
MKKKLPYKSINDTCKKIKMQVYDGLDYAINECPEFKSPEHIFYWLKRRTRYKHDPRGVELLQTLPTLLENNWHGENGAGDCDCFTIAFLTLMIANGFHNDLYVVLVGRRPKVPVHIYAGYIDANGIFKVCDLTNKHFDSERNYPYKQHLIFKA